MNELLGLICSHQAQKSHWPEGEPIKIMYPERGKAELGKEWAQGHAKVQYKINKDYLWLWITQSYS